MDCKKEIKHHSNISSFFQHHIIFSSSLSGAQVAPATSLVRKPLLVASVLFLVYPVLMVLMVFYPNKSSTDTSSTETTQRELSFFQNRKSPPQSEGDKTQTQILYRDTRRYMFQENVHPTNQAE